jgi:type II secretory pathway component PulF
VRTGALSDVLNDLVDFQRTMHDLWRRVWSALSYPMLVLAALGVVIIFVLAMVVPPIKEVYLDFETTLPPMTLGWLWLAGPGLSILGALCTLLVVACLILRMLGGPVVWTRCVSTVPLFGCLVHWAGVAEFTRLLKILLVREVPLPEALQLTAVGLSNTNLADVSRWLSEGTAAGLSLSDLMSATKRIPASAVPVVRWGEQTGALPEALESVHDIFAGRVRLRASLLATELPPLVLILVAAGALGLVVGLFAPMVMLLQNLT